MTKTQAKSQLQKLIDRLEDIRTELEMLGDDIQDTADNIEPYGDAYDLTPLQEERQEWMQDTADSIIDEVSNLEDIISNLGDLTL